MTDFVGTDLNAARRNLVLISVAFIVYALGDGELGTKAHDGAGFGFFGGSIYMKNTAFLGYFSCALYIWFMLRYIQEYIDANAWYWTLRSMPKGYLIRLYLRSLSVKAGSAKADKYEILYNKEFSKTFLSSWAFKGDTSTSTLIIPWWSIPLKIIFLCEAALIRKQFAIYYFPFILWSVGAALVYQYTYR